MHAPEASASSNKVRRFIRTNGEGKPAMLALGAMVGLAFAAVGLWQAGLILTGLTAFYVAALALLEPRWFTALDRGEAARPYAEVFALRTAFNWLAPSLLVLFAAIGGRAEYILVAFVTLLAYLAMEMTRALATRTRIWIYASGPIAGIAALAGVAVSRSLGRGDASWIGVILAFALLAVTVHLTWRYLQAILGHVFALRQKQAELIAQLTAANEETKQAHARLTEALASGETGAWEMDLMARASTESAFLTRLFGQPLTYANMRSGEALAMIIPEDRDRVSALFMRLHKAPGHSEVIEHGAYLADGSIGYVRTSAQSFAGEDGRIHRIVLSTTNITEQRRQELEFAAMLSQAEAALRRRRRLLSALKGAPEAAEDDEPDRPAVPAAMRCQLASVLAEMDVRDLALAKAVETVLEAQARAEEASLAKSQFLANMSHELRTPLNAIIGYSEIVVEDLTNAGLTAPIPDVERIRAAGKHLLGLISEVLDLSKIEAGRLEVHPEPCDAAVIARDAIETVEIIAAKCGSVCELIIDCPNTALVTDPVRLKQCLLNLLSNAVKFTEKGRITLTLRQTMTGDVPGLAFIVKDTGIGIAPDNLARLFQPFVQVDGSRTRRAGGAGIGLVITKRLAALLGGDVTVTSALGEGSVFTLTVRSLTMNEDEVWVAA